ncbi:MAG: DNA recombination protein RmuC [Gammaproteobacteria bacterium]|nr:MAG: DNA recombination protein RmuC [Gammaproteobacteria bacterium]
MANLQAFWSQHAPELSLALLTLLLLWLLWRMNRQQRELHRLQQVLEEQSMTLLDSQDRARRELVDAIIKGQVLTQEGMHRSVNELQETLGQRQALLQRQLMLDSGNLKENLLERFEGVRKAVTESLADGQLKQQEALGESLERISRQLRESLAESRSVLDKRVDRLTETTEACLKEISGQVEKRLTEGFEKTTETFARVLEHLSRIDEAQKRITELSASVVSLQEILTDKRTRGAFGEVQLEGLVRNLMPEGSFALQHTLSNGTRVDCVLFLPDPSGNVPIDAKFPLESYQRMVDYDAPESEREQARRRFRQDIRRHVQDIAGKYLIPGETSEGAVMFLPAESVFAEIHAHFPDLVEEAQRARVWLASPTTLMAILTTASAVIKDIATRRQVNVIQEHLRYLAADFDRFRERMDRLAMHIRQAHEDAQQVNTSAKKISSRFVKIEKVELDELDEEELPPPQKDQET